MLGSFADAEDAVQETMLAAWQGIGGFTEERASLRTWLYKIATNRCLNARRAASRRPARNGTCLGPNRPCRPRATSPSGCSRFLTPSSGRRRPAARAGGPLRADRSHLAGLRDRPAAAAAAPDRRPHLARRPRLPRQRGGRHAGGDRRIGQQRPQTSPRQPDSAGSPPPAASRRPPQAHPPRTRSWPSSPARGSRPTSTRWWPC